jgi:hypothetical protein
MLVSRSMQNTFLCYVWAECVMFVLNCLVRKVTDGLGFKRVNLKCVFETLLLSG